MSEKKSSNLLQTEDIEYSQFHSDSDSLPEDRYTALLVKSEKKKSITNNFGRPRKHPYKPGKYKCSYCDTLCSKPSVLTKHMRAHTNERPFPCSVCERSFKTKSNLSKHEKSKSHSSKLGENHGPAEPNQSNVEKADLMLQALTGRKLNAPCVMKNLEFDGPGHRTPMSESGNYSPTSSDDKSMISDDNSIPETVKKEKNLDQIQDNIGDLSEITESSSSCSGVLTINSQGGPITVEVQINLETMRHLQQGLSNMTNKRNSPSSPIQSITSRNDAELRAAESILQMSNQRLALPENHFTKDDIRKNGTAIRKPPAALSPLNRKSPDPVNLYKPITVPTVIAKSSSPKDKSNALEESDPLSSKKQKKCLVKENLLKKMQRKQVQEITYISGTDTTVIGTICTCLNNKVPESTLINSSSFIFNPSLYINKPSIPDPKPAAVLLNPLKPAKVKPGILIQKTQLLSSNSHILNCIATTCNSPTIVLLAQTNSPSRTIACDSKSNSGIGIGSFSESSKLNISMTNCNLDIDTATLSKVITNTQSLHQHQGNKPSNPDNLSVTNIITTSRVAISSSCIDTNHDVPLSDSIDKSTDPMQQFVKNEHDINADEFNPSTYQKQISSHTIQESENESSPRLCIVEDPQNSSTQINNFDKKASESDEEEIDVVNTDSDDDRLSLKRIADIAYSEDVTKKRRISCDEDSESTPKEVKRIKDVEKCVHLHAPNINAKDLMQDCPLNLSANRQPTIPPVSQIPVSVLQNLYQTISPSSVSISSLTNSSNAFEPDPHINSLTNHNPAHPQSFQNFSSSGTPFSTNGHHHDYPIFEDKISCDVCSQMIEPSMLSLHKNMHIYTNSKDSHPHGGHSTKAGSSASSSDSVYPQNSKIPFNKPRTYKCVVCNIAFRVIGHLRKHHKSKTHLLGLVNSGLLSKALYSKIEQSKVPIPEVIDQKTGNIIPDVLSRYISNWSQPSTDSEPH